MLKRMTVGTAVAAIAALALQVQVSAQQQGAAGEQRRAVGGTTAGNGAYPTDEQYKNWKEAQAFVAKAKAIAGNDAKLQARFQKAGGPLAAQRPAGRRQKAGLPRGPERPI